MSNDFISDLIQSVSRKVIEIGKCPVLLIDA